MHKHRFIFFILAICNFWIFGLAKAQEAMTVGEKESQVAFHSHGPLGLFSLFSAERVASGPFSIGVALYADYFFLNDFPVNGTDSERAVGRASLNWTPKQNLEFFFSGWALSSNQSDATSLIQQVGNINFGFKWAEDLSGTWSAGVLYEGDLRRPLYDRGLTNYPLSHTGFIVTTLRFTPIKLHANLGFRLDDTQDYAHPALTEKDAILLEALGENAIVGGVGMEVLLKRVNLSVEYSTEQTIQTANIDYLDHPQRVTLGFRYFPHAYPKLSFGFAADIGMFATRNATRIYKEPKYAFQAGITYYTGRGPQEVVVPESTSKLENTIVIGKVLDAKTEKPIGHAQINFCNSSVSPILSDPDTGLFKSYPLRKGDCLVKVAHPDYDELEMTLSLDGPELVQDFKLVRQSAPQGFLSLSIKDTEGQGIMADIAFPQIPSAQTVKTNLQGNIRMRLPEGKYLVEVRAEGKRSEQKIFEIIANSDVEGEYILADGSARLDNEKIVITRQVQFAPGKANIREESEVTLDDVANILQEHTEIKKLEVGGHTDATGSAVLNKRLSQRRAQAVVNYLVGKGISRGRLVAIGFGQDKPIASNATPEGRYANRRVEFRVISR